MTGAVLPRRRASRFAALGRRNARLVLIAALLILLGSLTALALPPLADASGGAAPTAAQGAGDLSLYRGIVDGMRAGGDYYTVAADMLRAGDYPLRPFLAFRLPTLASILASLPPIAVLAMQWALVLAVFLAWFARLRGESARLPAMLAMGALLGLGLIAFAQPPLAAFHEIWAGLMIALALARWRPDRWIEPAAYGLAAMTIRETAALFPLVMAALALVEGRRREAGGWAITLAIFAIVVAVHGWTATGVARAADPASPGWMGLNGFGFFVQAAVASTGLSLLPLAFAAPPVALALIGWASWADRTGLRVTATLAGYAVAIGVFARTDTFYWALLAAPILPLGLFFVPRALSDLSTRALDRRRVRVQRLTR